MEHAPPGRGLAGRRARAQSPSRRRYSILVQRSTTTFSPASAALCAASGAITPLWPDLEESLEAVWLDEATVVAAADDRSVPVPSPNEHRVVYARDKRVRLPAPGIRHDNDLPDEGRGAEDLVDPDVITNRSLRQNWPTTLRREVDDPPPPPPPAVAPVPGPADPPPPTPSVSAPAPSP